MKSIVQQRGRVPFPIHVCERVYMREFRKQDGLPSDLARWQPTVNAMLAGVDTDGPIYLMVDQGLVKAGSSHRRPGIHIDGYWVPALHAHGGGHRGGGHSGDSGEGQHRGGGHMTASWGGSDYGQHEALILASDITGCRALVGDYQGVPGEGGDCTHVDTSGLKEVLLQPGFAYAGNVTMLHESLPAAADCLRTLVRLNVPGWTPET